MILSALFYIRKVTASTSVSEVTEEYVRMVSRTAYKRTRSPLE
jgi:hypothetical protein